MRVLLVAHSISPLRGSEPGLSWNWARYLSEYHEIWTISHPEFSSEVDDYLAVHPNPRLRIMRLKGSDWDPSKGQQGVQRHYLKWLPQAEALAKRLHAEHKFDLVHHVSFSSVSAPPKLWELGIPFVWGPLGGAQICPPSLISLFGEGRMKEHLRTLRVRLLPWLPKLRKTVRKAATVLATNFETQQTLKAAGAREAPLFWDNGLADDAIFASRESHEESATVKVLWASRMEKRKALSLGLRAMRLLPQDARVELFVAGSGPEYDRWKQEAADLGLKERVHFLGHLEPAEMKKQFASADIFLFTSIRDSCASVVLEAMAHAIPIVTLDLHGVGAYMPAEAGIKVPVGDVESVTREITDALIRLAGNATLRREMGHAGWQYAERQRWSERAERMNQIYRACVEAKPI